MFFFTWTLTCSFLSKSLDLRSWDVKQRKICSRVVRVCSAACFRWQRGYRIRLGAHWAKKEFLLVLCFLLFDLTQCNSFELLFQSELLATGKFLCSPWPTSANIFILNSSIFFFLSGAYMFVMAIMGKQSKLQDLSLMAWWKDSKRCSVLNALVII